MLGWSFCCPLRAPRLRGRPLGWRARPLPRDPAPGPGSAASAQLGGPACAQAWLGAQRAVLHPTGPALPCAACPHGCRSRKCEWATLQTSEPSRWAGSARPAAQRQQQRRRQRMAPEAAAATVGARAGMLMPACTVRGMWLGWQLWLRLGWHSHSHSCQPCYANPRRCITLQVKEIGGVPVEELQKSIKGLRGGRCAGSCCGCG